MIEDDRYCIDILVQIAAIKSAAHQIGLALLVAYRRCVTDALEHNNSEDEIHDVMDVVRQFTKS